MRNKRIPIIPFSHVTRPLQSFATQIIPFPGSPYTIKETLTKGQFVDPENLATKIQEIGRWPYHGDIWYIHEQYLIRVSENDRGLYKVSQIYDTNTEIGETILSTLN